MQKFNLLSKILKFSLFFFSLFFLCTPVAFAADYQCSPETSPEYHSLRPYPGDSCNKSLENLSYSCGNTMIIRDNISVLPEDASSCLVNREAGTEICYFNISHKTIDISVDTSNSTLPIAGLTDGDFVVNSEKQPNPEEVDNETKMSEYMSWYLSGIAEKAEYSPYEEIEDINKSVNLAGPIKKLLPWLIQDKNREEEVSQAGSTRHNQVIGCLDSSNQAVACYPQRPGVREIRLTNWEGNLSSSYIPFSSTEDLKGEVSLSKPGNAGGSLVVKNEDISFTGTPSTLYFPHMQEGSDLADTLQPTYKAKGLNDETASDIQAPTFESGCKILEVRSNQGDKLLGDTALGTLSYSASFDCTFNLKNPSACSKQAVFASEIKVSTPKADDIWTKLVAGTSGVVRRIFPKFGSGGLGMMIDLPAVTSADYSSTAKETSPANGELYIPHLGGISEYFLKGIQAMLRPKGYGEQIILAAGVACEGENTSVPEMVPAQGSCKLGKNNLNLPPTFVEIVETAAETFKVPPSLIIGVIYGEGGFERYQITEENVQNWMKNCAKIPKCTSGAQSSGIAPFFAIYWPSISKAIQEHFPGRNPDPCNLFDSVLGVAWSLADGVKGNAVFEGRSCFGINLNTTGTVVKNSCSWTNSDIETAIKTWESGYEINCFTKKGGCLKGNRTSQCTESGAANIDICEKYNDYSTGASEISHNACVWDVYIKNK